MTTRTSQILAMVEAHMTDSTVVLPTPMEMATTIVLLKTRLDEACGLLEEVATTMGIKTKE